MASLTKIKPYDDPRISLRSAILNGHTYGYLYSAPSPSAPPRGTIILIHGFPDISFGWRYQIPLLTSLGLEVIALDCLGYGRSDAPGSDHLSPYTYKTIADDIAALCEQRSLARVILGGHDWGGAIVYRVRQRHPTLVSAFFAICTPYTAPSPTYTPLALLTRTHIPNFTYQLQFASGAVERAVRSPAEIRQFLSALYGARTVTSDGSRGAVGFTAEEGAHLPLLPRIGASKLLSPDEMDYYVAEYARHGLNGPLNWYRTRELNHLDDLDLFFDGRDHGWRDAAEVERRVRIAGCEVLFVQATRDAALKPFLARKMADRVERLTWKRVDAGHWALWERADECNAIIEAWLKEKVFGEGGGKANL